MDNVLANLETEMMEAIETFKKRLTNVRTGRANPNILDGVFVEYYGVKTPLRQVATVSVMDARTLVIKPFDKNSLKEIEKAITVSDLGFSPNNNGETVLINLPLLTEETRKDLVKQVKKMGEEAKIAIRNLRQDSNSKIKASELTDDEKEYNQEQVQKVTDKYNALVEEILKNKETELMTV